MFLTRSRCKLVLLIGTELTIFFIDNIFLVMKSYALSAKVLGLVTRAIRPQELVSVNGAVYSNGEGTFNSSTGFSLTPFLAQIINLFLIFRQFIQIAVVANFKVKNTKTLTHLDIYQGQLNVKYAYIFSQLSKKLSK